MPTTQNNNFDGTFDYTFGDLFPITEIEVQECESKGILLHWLSGMGWISYPFAGKRNDEIDATSAGEFEQGGALRDTLRYGQDVFTLRAPRVIESTSRVIKSIYTSPAVYAELNNGTKKRYVLVNVPKGTYSVWNSDETRINISFKILFPKNRFQRA